MDGAGTKVVELWRDGLHAIAKELWTSNRLRLHHGNAMRIGGAYHFTSGGKYYWQERSIGKSTFLRAGDNLI